MRTGDVGSRALGLYWAAVVIASALAAPLVPRAAALVPRCLFLSVTGLPCPTCGATRAAVALSRLDFSGAFALSPLAAAGFLAFLLGGLIAGVAAMAGRPLREPARYGPAVRVAVILAVGLNWIWLLARSMR